MKYYSCREIEGGIHFFRNQLNFCCVSYGDNKGFMKIIDYSGGPIPLDEIKNERNKLRRSNQLGSKAPCAGCPKLELRNWEEDDGRFDFLSIGNYALCNLTCKYCYIFGYTERERKENAKPLYDVLDAVSQLATKDKFKKEIVLVWAGGEPTLYKEFDDIYRLLEDNNITPSSFIYSNCTIFSQSIAKGLEKGNILLDCSIDSGNAETYKKIKQVNAFDKVKDNLKKYLSINSQNVLVKYIIIEENSSPKEVDDFIKMCVDIGAKNIIISQDTFKRPTGAKEIEKIISAFAYLAFLAQKNGIKYNFEPMVFDKSDFFKARLLMLQHLSKSAHTDFNSLASHLMHDLYNDFKIISKQNIPANANQDIEEINENSSEEVNSYLTAAENSIKWRNNYYEAIDFYKAALSDEPYNIKIFNLLADAFVEVGEIENAIAVLKDAININAKNKELIKKLATLYLEIGNSALSFNVLYEYMLNKINDEEITDLSKKIFSVQYS